KNNKLNLVKKIGFTTATIIVIANIILWITLIWFNEDFLSTKIYHKIIITSIAVTIVALIFSGYTSYLVEESELKKDKFIN
ncbi:MAG: uncharacterized membrane protein (DUF485 family), partial [Rickettsiales bacterium]